MPTEPSLNDGAGSVRPAARDAVYGTAGAKAL
jgi:hypothetical protein